MINFLSHILLSSLTFSLENDSKLAPFENFDDEITLLGCERSFIYQGKTYACDSLHKKDAEKLRTFFKNDPEAIRSLEIYQKNRKTARVAAYTGTIGILLILSGLIFSPKLPSDRAHSRFKAAAVWGGTALTAGSFIYSFGRLKSNENNLENAINAYNKNHSDDPITLKFETGVSF